MYLGGGGCWDFPSPTNLMKTKQSALLFVGVLHTETAPEKCDNLLFLNKRDQHLKG